MSTNYRFQSTFNPNDDIGIIVEKLNREFKALERARAAASGSTTVINNAGGGGGGGGSSFSLTIRTLNGALVLNDINEIALNTTVGLVLSALGGSSAEISLALTTDLVPEGSSNLYFTEPRSIEALGKVTGEPTGFKHEKDDTPNTPSAISFIDGTRTFTIQPTGASFTYWINGVAHVVTTPQSLAISNVTGMHFIYFDSSGVLAETVGTFDIAILVDNAYVAAVYWSATLGVHIYLGDERHGNAMSWATHRLFHTTIGTRYVDGLALSDIVPDATGDQAVHAQFGSAAGHIMDEDLIHAIAAKIAPAQIPIYYRFGAGDGIWKVKAADTYPLIYTGSVGADYAGTRLPYNQNTGATWQLTEVGNLNFILLHYFATNDGGRQIIGVQGQHEYGTLALARAGAAVEINTLVLSKMVFEEFHPIATVIFQTANAGTYTNVPHARVRTTDAGENYVDWRLNELSPAVGAIIPNHNSLVGLQGGGGSEFYHLILTDYTKVTTETFVNMNLSGYIKQAAMTAPSNPAADNILLYVRKIAGTPNEVRYVIKDTNGSESILHSYTY